MKSPSQAKDSASACRPMQTNLFQANQTSSFLNLLPKDGYVQYFPAVFSERDCALWSTTLLQSLDWRVDQLYMFGKLITTKRKVAWVGDPGCSYTYSGVKKEPQSWTAELLHIKSTLEEIAQWNFNSCLLNLYHDGSEGMGWHSDDEPELDQNAPIASLSLGGERKFSFKHKTDKTNASVLLENGSVLLMHAPTQECWNHSLVKTARPVAPRINLTFRAIKS
jgi:alkylated DNA repair dioxygenase AlkB